MSEPQASDTADLAVAYERERSCLRAVALRMLGSVKDADRLSEHGLDRKPGLQSP